MLVSVSDLTTDQVNSVSTDATDVGVASTRIIESVESSIASHLDRTLELARHFETPEWVQVEGGYEFFTKDFPVRWVKQSVTIKGNRRIFSTTAHEEIEYIAGYAGADDNLSSVQSRFPELSELPEQIKPNIRRCIVALSQYELNRTMGNTFGRASHTTVTGNQTATIQKESGDVYGDELRKIETEMNL